MKLITFKIALILFLCLTHNALGHLRTIRNRKTKLSKFKTRARADNEVYENKFYSICVTLDSNHQGDCKGVKWYEVIYNCDLSSAVVNKGLPGNFVYKDPKFPNDMKIEILKKSNCYKTMGWIAPKKRGFTEVVKEARENHPTSYYTLRGEVFPVSIRESDNQTRLAKVRLINGWIKNNLSHGLPHNFGESVVSFNPKWARHQNIKWLSEQMNSSIRLLKESLLLPETPKDPTFQTTPEEIFLNPESYSESRTVHKNDKFKAEKLLESHDLKILKAGLYVENIIEGVYHQVIYVCAMGKNQNGEDRAFHFISDRAARDPTHEKQTIGKVIWNTLIRSSLLTTLVRLTYYNSSTDCNDPTQRPDDRKFNPNFDLALISPLTSNMDPELVAHYKKNPQDRNIFRPLNPNGKHYDLTDTIFYSFNDFVMGIQRYAWMYENYEPLHNCQHFATGMFNYLTGNDFDPINVVLMRTFFFDKEKHMRFRDWHFFDRGVSDESYREKARELWARAFSLV